MTTILAITSSPRGNASRSNRLAGELIDRLLRRHQDARVLRRDLAADAVHLLDPEALAALGAPADRRTPEQRTLVDQFDALVRELKLADVIVFAVPMYNFAVPVQLKAYFDAIARAGVTFRYTANGAEGMIQGKKVYVVFARGGIHRDLASDVQTPFVQTLLGFLGMTDVQYIFAEGLDMGPEAERSGLAAARATIAAL